MSLVNHLSMFTAQCIPFSSALQFSDNVFLTKSVSNNQKLPTGPWIQGAWVTWNTSSWPCSSSCCYISMNFGVKELKNAYFRNIVQMNMSWSLGRVQIKTIFNLAVLSLYISADMKKDISITSDPVDEFQSVRSHFGVVFQGQSNGKVIVHISWLGKRHLHNLQSNGWISKCQGSFWGSFSRPIQWLGHCTLQLTWKNTSP